MSIRPARCGGGRRSGRSLRRDLTISLGLGLVALWLAALAIGWAILAAEIDEIYDAALTRTAERLAAVGTGAPPQSPITGAAAGGGDGALRVRIVDAAGRTIHAVGQMPAPGAAGLSRSGDLRVLTMPLAGGGVLQLADPLAERREAVREALLAGLVPFALMLPLAIWLAGWFIARQLAPVTALSREVAGRGAADLRPLPPAPLPAELQPLHDAVDRLMTRLAAAMAAERAFSSNAAHELRTPIAAALAQAQMMQAEATDPALAQRAAALAAQLRRVGQLAAKLLELARAEANPGALCVPQDVRQALALVASDFPGAALTMPDGPHRLAVDLDAFAVIARNLIENAVLHGAAPVMVVLAGDTLSVCNAGPPVAPEVLAGLTQRFQRGTSRAPGTGLGLAIAEGHARREGAALRLTSPAPGRDDGFCAAVRFRR